MGVVEGVGQGWVNLYAVELYQRSQIFSQPDTQTADRAKAILVRSVDHAAVWSYWQARPILEVLASRKVK